MNREFHKKKFSRECFERYPKQKSEGKSDDVRMSRIGFLKNIEQSAYNSVKLFVGVVSIIAVPMGLGIQNDDEAFSYRLTYISISIYIIHIWVEEYYCVLFICKSLSLRVL